MERISDETRLERLLEPFSGRNFVSPRGAMNYSVTGSGERGAFLLVAGLSMHRSEWSPELISTLHAAGYATITADNRDCGFSLLDGRHASDVEAEADLSYGLVDLAADLRDLVVHLGYERVHVVGISMGGMIAQHLALLAPELVGSLTSLMSTTGRRGVGRPHEQAKWIFTTETPLDSLDSYLDYARKHHEAIAGSRYPDPERAIDNAMIAWQKGIRVEGTTRQLAAIRADGDRSDRLAGVTVSTLVIHGEADPMIDISGGADTAAAIPGSRFVRIPDMGHSVPWQLADMLGETIVAHAEAAESARSTSQLARALNGLPPRAGAADGQAQSSSG